MIEELLRKNLFNIEATSILEIDPGYNIFGRVVAEIVKAKELDSIDFDEKILKYQKEQIQKLKILTNTLKMLLNSYFKSIKDFFTSNSGCPATSQILAKSF